MKKQTPEDWRLVSKAFAHTQELPVSERETYLVTLPAPLQIEVRSLLLHGNDESDFLERSAQSGFTQALSIRETSYTAGDTIGDFKLIEKIGEGSFGTVFRARQLSLERDIALKITPNLGNEAQVMAHLEHDGIVGVFSETIDEKRQIRFVCMPFIPGKSLEKCLSFAKDEETIVRLGIQLSEALNYAHERGVLHLDVKPSNILLHDSGRAFLTDFNVSLSKHREQTLSLYGGTKDFMPPEQEACLKGVKGASSTDLNETSDIFSLGRVLEVITEHSKIDANLITPNFRWVLEKCTAPKKSERIQKAEDLTQLLSACLENLQIQKELRKKDFYAKFASRYRHTTLILSILIPHFIGSIINISYNSMRIVSNLSDKQQAVFEKLLFLTNPIIYGTSLVLLFVILGPLLKKRSALPMEELRKKALSAPLTVALVSGFAWAISALIFPFGIHFLAEPLPTEIFLHFFISFFLSAMVATTYSSLNSQYFFLRTLYPNLWVGCTDLRKTAANELESLIPKIRSFYYIAGTVPLIGAGLMVLVGPETLHGASYAIYQGLLATFIAMGIIGVFYSMNSSRDLSETVGVLTR